MKYYFVNMCSVSSSERETVCKSLVINKGREQLKMSAVGEGIYISYSRKNRDMPARNKETMSALQKEK